jgi:hypothetical protein
MGPFPCSPAVLRLRQANTRFLWDLSKQKKMADWLIIATASRGQSHYRADFFMALFL